MVNDAPLHLDLAGVQIALVIGHVVVGVPETEFDRGKERKIFPRRTRVPHNDLMYFRIVTHGYETGDFHADAVLFAGNDRVSHAVAALVKVKVSPTRLPRRRPDEAVVVHVEVPAVRVRRNVVVAVAQNPAQPGVFIKAVTARRI
jgi:hypothetical protein